MPTSTDELVDMTAYTFRTWRDPNSNAYKILKLFGDQIDKAIISTRRIAEWHDIDAAAGKALDEIGAQYGVTRTTREDDFYRFMIKCHIEMSNKVGTTNELIKVLANTSGLPTSAFNVENGSEPLSIKVIDMPTVLTPTPEQRQKVIDWIKSVLPAGVRLGGVSFRDATNGEVAMGVFISEHLFENAIPKTSGFDPNWV